MAQKAYLDMALLLGSSAFRYLEIVNLMANIIPRALISTWTTTPIPHLRLSAGGLLALADLHTVARRTALNGGSSWIDALVLAPGLHYQQACDNLDQEETPGWLDNLSAVDLDEVDVKHVIKNVLTLKYLKKLYRDGGADVVTIDVGMLRVEGLGKKIQKMIKKAHELQDDDGSLADVDWLSHFLFLMSPLLTVGAITFMVLLEDWWGLCIIVSLMFARILNIWAIKHRTDQAVQSPIPINKRHTEYTIDLGQGRIIHLRGNHADLQALTTQAWLKSQSNVDSYLEACAKLIVYLVAALSGNLSQAGAIVLIILLLLSVALLGLSNAHTKGFRMHGRYALQVQEIKTSSDVQTGSSTALESAAERGESRARQTPKMTVSSTSEQIG